MGNGGNFAGQPGQTAVVGCERITAAVNDFADAAVVADIVEGLVPLAGAEVCVVLLKMATEAIAAVDGATTADDQQQATMVLVNDPGPGIGVLFSEGVEYIPRLLCQLFADWQDLT